MNEIYVSSSGTLTVLQLEVYSERIAEYLAKNGIRTAAVITGKSPLVFAAIRGCLMARVCYIPVDEALPEYRLNNILVNADIVLYDSAETCGRAGYLDLQDIVGFASPVENRAASGEKSAWQEKSTAFLRQTDDSHPAYRIYTSGTTGEPKGIEVSCGNVSSFLRWFCGIPAIAEVKPRSVLNQAMFSFDLSVADIYYSLYTGAALTVIERSLTQDFSGLFRRMSKSRAELAVFTPAFAELCLCDSSFCSSLMPELRVIFFCGEVLKPMTAAKLFRRFPGVRIINAYGPTETCCAVTAAEITPDMTAVALPIGDLSHTAGEIHIAGNGEIVIYGNSVARYADGLQGGFRDTGAGRCFYTGDLGYTEDGKLYFNGRLDQQIKIMGFRIEPADIENNLMKIGGVLQAAVSASQRGSRQSISAVVRTDGSVSAEEIHRNLAELVPQYMLPSKITIADEIPFSSNGKLKRGGSIGE